MVNSFPFLPHMYVAMNWHELKLIMMGFIDTDNNAM
jgi:hypothetical protein